MFYYIQSPNGGATVMLDGRFEALIDADGLARLLAYLDNKDAMSVRLNNLNACLHHGDARALTLTRTPEGDHDIHVRRYRAEGHSGAILWDDTVQGVVVDGYLLAA